MKALDYIFKKYNLNPNQRSPIEIPNQNRYHLAHLFNELGYKTGAEIGVEEATYSKAICERVKNVKLYCVDPWKVYRRRHKDFNRKEPDQKMCDEFYEISKKRLEPYNARIIRKTSMEAVKNFEPNSLDFVYIDGHHEFRHAVDDISEWIKIVRTGGIISGHDYCRRKDWRYLVQVVEAVKGYTQAYHIKHWFVMGRKEIIEGEARDACRSWFWVKR